MSKMAIIYVSVHHQNTEKVANYLGFNNKCFDWNYIFEDYRFFKNDNKIKFLEEKEDFFKKHPSQLV